MIIALLMYVFPTPDCYSVIYYSRDAGGDWRPPTHHTTLPHTTPCTPSPGDPIPISAHSWASCPTADSRSHAVVGPHPPTHIVAGTLSGRYTGGLNSIIVFYSVIILYFVV